ncbi:MAG: hypothetical protein IJ897_04350 [Prevotella sp.]|nr:hypothetical protein [Prevotella sp.]
MFKGLKHMSKGCELLSKDLEHKFSGLEYKIYRGERENPSRKEEKTSAEKMIISALLDIIFGDFKYFL